jgi:hypothetical protein
MMASSDNIASTLQTAESERDHRLSQIGRAGDVAPSDGELVDQGRARTGTFMRTISTLPGSASVLMHTAADEPESQARLAAFMQGLQDGPSVANLQIDYRWSVGDSLAT